jgi:hypothetical protein
MAPAVCPKQAVTPWPSPTLADRYNMDRCRRKSWICAEKVRTKKPLDRRLYIHELKLR